MDSKTMTNAATIVIDRMAGHLARKAAKAKGTESTKYTEGYTEAVVACANNPEMMEMLSAGATMLNPDPAAVAEGGA